MRPTSAGKLPSKRRRPEGERDQDPSIFTSILSQLVHSVPGATAAALVDYDGETVDYAGALDAFDLKVTAAHWQLVLARTTETGLFGPIRQITVRARGKSYLVRRIHAAYTVVVVLHPRAAFAAPERALQEADARLRSEAGFDVEFRESRWFAVEVRTEPSDRARPRALRVGNAWQSVEVMGAMVGLRPREKGFRVRLPSGAELLLVRERFGSWFADERLGER
jgi:predicted regulator of Ras-like GTPase activity (Roadblock/LC7/MglB family)